MSTILHRGNWQVKKKQDLGALQSCKRWKQLYCNGQALPWGTPWNQMPKCPIQNEYKETLQGLCWSTIVAVSSYQTWKSNHQHPTIRASWGRWLGEVHVEVNVNCTLIKTATCLHSYLCCFCFDKGAEEGSPHYRLVSSVLMCEHCLVLYFS